jgi:hypothetical protein
MGNEDRSKIGATSPQQGNGSIVLPANETGYDHDRKVLQRVLDSRKINPTGLRIQNWPPGSQAEANFVKNHGGNARTIERQREQCGRCRFTGRQQRRKRVFTYALPESVGTRQQFFGAISDGRDYCNHPVPVANPTVNLVNGCR